MDWNPKDNLTLKHGLFVEVTIRRGQLLEVDAGHDYDLIVCTRPANSEAKPTPIRWLRPGSGESYTVPMQMFSRTRTLCYRASHRTQLIPLVIDIETSNSIQGRVAVQLEVEVHHALNAYRRQDALRELRHEAQRAMRHLAVDLVYDKIHPQMLEQAVEEIDNPDLGVRVRRALISEPIRWPDELRSVRKAPILAAARTHADDWVFHIKRESERYQRRQILQDLEEQFPQVTDPTVVLFVLANFGKYPSLAEAIRNGEGEARVRTLEQRQQDVQFFSELIEKDLLDPVQRRRWTSAMLGEGNPAPRPRPELDAPAPRERPQHPALPPAERNELPPPRRKRPTTNGKPTKDGRSAPGKRRPRPPQLASGAEQTIPAGGDDEPTELGGRRNRGEHQPSGPPREPVRAGYRCQPAGDAYLMDTSYNAQQFPLCRGKTYIGRGSDPKYRNSIIVSDKRVSRRHAVILSRNGTYYLHEADPNPQQPKNIYLNGALLEGKEAALHDGDQIIIGDVRFELHLTPPEPLSRSARPQGQARRPRRRPDDNTLR